MRDDNKVTIEDAQSYSKRWVEAKEWLTYRYPEYGWEVLNHGSCIYTFRHDKRDVMVVPQEAFREWVRIVDYAWAMSLIVKSFD